jgi:hypothetical protein
MFLLVWHEWRIATRTNNHYQVNDEVIFQAKIEADL